MAGSLPPAGYGLPEKSVSLPDWLKATTSDLQMRGPEDDE